MMNYLICVIAGFVLGCIFAKLIRRDLYTIDHGFACGRHWISIDGKVIAQTSGNDVFMRDEEISRLIDGVIRPSRSWRRETEFSNYSQTHGIPQSGNSVSH